MRKIPATCFILMMLMSSFSSIARQAERENRNTRLFIECSEGSLCNLDFIRKELPVVDFVQDRFGADVHVLIVTQPTGNAGSAHTILFIGRNEPVRQDTAVFYTSASATEDENRKIMIRQVKMGLMPWLVRSTSANLVEISKHCLQKIENGFSRMNSALTPPLRKNGAAYMDPSTGTITCTISRKTISLFISKQNSGW